jgi:hypothetical protein
MFVYINGQLKSTCSDIALKREIPTAGVFILGQSHHANFLAKKTRKYSFGQTTTTTTSITTTKNHIKQKYNDNYNDFYNNNNNDGDTIDDYKETEFYDNEDPLSPFDSKSSFIGRIFNFNAWSQVKTTQEIQNLYMDCRLAHCGDATQWSDFRQGTRGNVTMRWPTDLLWKGDLCFSDRYQFDSCNKYCNKEIGPICREGVEKNIRWPITKANTTSRIKCFPNSNKHAYRHCNLVSHNNETKSSHGSNRYFSNSNEYSLNSYENFLLNSQSATWHVANIDECVQEPLIELKQNVYAFCTTDNFDETHIIFYLEKLYDLSFKHIKLVHNSVPSIFDVATIIDTINYLINAQVNIFLKKQIRLNLKY